MAPAIAAAAVAASALAHWRVASAGSDYTGLLLLLSHIFHIACALAMLVACYGIGLPVLRVLSRDADHPHDRLLFSVALGVGVIGTAILLLGLASLLSGLALLMLFLAFFWIARREIAALPCLLTECLSEAWPGKFRPGKGMLAALILIPIGFFMVVQSLAPPTDWDALTYHLTVPEHFLAAGAIRMPEDNQHVAFVGLLHMLYVPFLALRSDTAPAVLNAMLAVLLCLAVYSSAARNFGAPTGALSALTLWGTTTLLLVAATPRVDTTLALFLFLGHHALIRAGSSARGAFLLSAVLLGLSAGIKYHGLAYIVALGPLILVRAWRRGKPVVGSLLFGGVSLLTAAPWFVKNWFLLGSPLYPLLTLPRLPPWLAAVAGGPAIPGTVSSRIYEAYGQARETFNLVDLFLSPGRLTVEGEGALYFTNPLFLLLPLSLLFLRDRTLKWFVIPPVGYLLLVLVPYPQTNLRYLIPAVPPLTIAAAYVAVRIGRRVFSTRTFRPALAGIGALSLLPTLFAIGLLLSQTKTVGYALGTVSRRAYLADYPVASIPAYMEVVRFANDSLDEDDKILMLWEARGYYLEPQTLQDNVMVNWPLLVGIGADEKCLTGTRVSHVLVNSGAAGYFERRGMDLGPMRWDRFPGFSERCLVQVYRNPSFELYRVRRDAIPPSSAE